MNNFKELQKLSNHIHNNITTISYKDYINKDYGKKHFHFKGRRLDYEYDSPYKHRYNVIVLEQTDGKPKQFTKIDTALSENHTRVRDFKDNDLIYVINFDDFIIATSFRIVGWFNVYKLSLYIEDEFLKLTQITVGEMTGQTLYKTMLTLDKSVLNTIV